MLPNAMRRCFAPLLLLLLVFCAPQAIRAEGLNTRIQTEVDKSPNNQAHWGVAACDLSNGSQLISLDADKLFMPASNRKLFSTAFALDTLGSDFRFSTKLEYTGSIQADGTLMGDLIVRASGDPTISQRFSKSHTSTSVFEDWANAALQKGIHKVSGNLIADLSAFDPSTLLGEGWSWEYESDYYAAPVGAFSFNENVVFVGVSPTSAGEPCKVWLDPHCEGFVIQNQSHTRSSGDNTISVVRQNATNIITIKGSLPDGHSSEYNPVTVDDPGRYSSEVLMAVLKRKGIEVQGQVVQTHTAPPAVPEGNVIADYVSPPLSDILKVVNQSSNNNMAEMVYLAAGHVATGSPASYSNSRVAEKKFWDKMGIPDSGRMYAADGSGLSRRNLFTPRAFCELLRKMQQHKEGETYVKSLAVAGKNGTLEGRMNSITGHVIGKTGTINNVSCLSGYLINDENKTMVFSMLVNNFTCATSSIKSTQDRLCQLLVSEPIATAAAPSPPAETENGG